MHSFGSAQRKDDGERGLESFKGHDGMPPNGQAQRLEKEFKKGPRA